MKKAYLQDERRNMTVVNVNGEWINTDEVRFISIQEDWDGADLMTFEWNGKTHTSRVYSSR